MKFEVNGKNQRTEKLVGSKVTKDTFTKLNNIANNRKISISELIRQMIKFCLQEII